MCWCGRLLVEFALRLRLLQSCPLVVCGICVVVASESYASIASESFGLLADGFGVGFVGCQCRSRGEERGVVHAL